MEDWLLYLPIFWLLGVHTPHTTAEEAGHEQGELTLAVPSLRAGVWREEEVYGNKRRGMVRGRQGARGWGIGETGREDG